MKKFFNNLLGLGGSGLSVCSAHGPGINMWWDSNQNKFMGNYPYQNEDGVQCGTAGGQNISIEGCVANIEFHGYVHSDFPNVNYMGMATVDVRYQKSRTADNVQITIYTPKSQIKLNGKVPAGSSFMSSCP